MKKIFLWVLIMTGISIIGCSKSEGGINTMKAIDDSKKINNANLWPKPKNPVASDSEKTKNIEVVQRFFQAYGKEDLDGIRAVMHENVEWYIPGRHVLSGTKRGVDEVMSFFKNLQKVGFKSEVMIVAANDHYVIDAHRGWSTTGKNDIDLNWILIYQIEDDKIRRVQNFSGDLYSSDEFFNRFYGK